MEDRNGNEIIEICEYCGVTPIEKESEYPYCSTCYELLFNEFSPFQELNFDDY